MKRNEAAKPVTRGIDFDTLAWTEIMPGLRAKVYEDEGRTVRLVEFGPGFVEPGWCEKSHVGYVLRGRLTVQFDEGIEIFKAGQALHVRDGPSNRHKVCQDAGQSAVLFLTEPD